MGLKKEVEDNLKVMIYTIPIASVILLTVFFVRICNPPIDRNKIIPINEKFNHLSKSNIEKIDILFFSRSTSVPNSSIIITNKNIINVFKNSIKSSKNIVGSMVRHELRYRVTIHYKDKSLYQFYFKYKLRSGEDCPQCTEAGAEEDNQVYLFDYPIEQSRDSTYIPDETYRVGFYCNNDLLKFIKQYVDPYKDRKVYEIK